MKIATMATGGIGGYLAVKLSQAGHQIACVARGAHLSAIQTQGVIRPWKVSEDPAEIGPVDAIIFGVKAAALDQAAQKCRPMLGEHTVVIPFQNGVTATSDLMGILPNHHIASGVALISTTISEPGVITQTGNAARFLFAERDSVRSARITALQAAFQQAGIAAPETKDITLDLWMKFVLFSAMSGITATARCTVGDILASQALGRLFCQVMEETAMACLSRLIVQIRFGYGCKTCHRKCAHQRQLILNMDGRWKARGSLARCQSWPIKLACKPL